MLDIMVVDDSLLLRRSLTSLLQKMGHNVVAQAKSGKEALDLYPKHKPHLITLDITMPVMNGIETLKKIREKYKDEVKVIMITSHGEEELVIDAITNGAKGYVLKPITEDKLAEVIIKAVPEYYIL